MSGVTAKSVKESIKYGVSYDDLNAYMMDGGTIFFVVYIDKEKRKNENVRQKKKIRMEPR